MKALLSHGLRFFLIALVLTAMGCQGQRKTQEKLALLQKNMDSNAERMVSLIEKLEANQRNINEDLRTLKAAQHNIATEVIPAQHQLAQQFVETTRIIRKDQAELRMALQATSLEMMQSQDKVQEDLAAMQKNLSINTENALSLIQELERGQRSTSTEIKNLQTAQCSITTQVISAQQQLADQLTETAELIRQDQAEQKRTLQAEYAHLTQQVKTLGQRQERLERTTETIQADGQILQKRHDQGLAKLAEWEKAYQARQEQLSLMRERLDALDANVMAVLTNLSQFENALKADLRAKHAAQDEKIRRTEQSLNEKFAGFNDMLDRVGKARKTLTQLRQEVDKPNTASSRASVMRTESTNEERETASPPSPGHNTESEHTTPAPPAPPYE